MNKELQSKIYEERFIRVEDLPAVDVSLYTLSNPHDTFWGGWTYGMSKTWTTRVWYLKGHVLHESRIFPYPLAHTATISKPEDKNFYYVSMYKQTPIVYGTTLESVVDWGARMINAWDNKLCVTAKKTKWDIPA